MQPTPLTLISGGQTGVDRATLDVAIKLGIPYKGWCPAGRWAEDGRISEKYLLCTTPDANPAQRTVRNVRQSDGVLILGGTLHSEGTKLAMKTATALKRSVFHAEFHHKAPPILQWFRTLQSGAVNVAGPRESEQPGVYQQAFHFLEEVLSDYLTACSSTS